MMTYELLPPRGAMHRDIPKGSRLEIANAYAVGRLIDGQAITDALEMAWGVIANANNGDWDTASDEWRKAAEKWRDEYHRLSDALTKETDGR